MKQSCRRQKVLTESQQERWLPNLRKRIKNINKDHFEIESTASIKIRNNKTNEGDENK